MEHRHLVEHSDPRIRVAWSSSEAIEISSLFQRVGNGKQSGQRSKGTDAFYFIKQDNVPKNKAKDTTCTRVVCTICEIKNLSIEQE